jgi:CheY-like chemotaxis protein
MARLHQPAVILLDINLPGMSGNDMMSILHASPSTIDIPVIALSANAMPQDVVDSMTLGFFHYLTKPINIDQFFAALDSALAASTERAAGN